MSVDERLTVWNSDYDPRSRAKSEPSESFGIPIGLGDWSPCRLGTEANLHCENPVWIGASGRLRRLRAASWRTAPDRFGVAAATAVRWVRVWRAAGITQAKAKGGGLRSGWIAVYQDAIMLPQTSAEATSPSQDTSLHDRIALVT